jgi:hypothetical protein
MSPDKSEHFVPEFNWRTPLDAMERVKVTDRDAYTAGIANCAQSLDFLDLTLSRLETANIEYYTTLDRVAWFNNPDQPQLIPQEFQSFMRRNDLASRQMRLDYENFILHARIAMDKLCYLTIFLLPIRNLPMSFTKHRKWFFENHTIPDRVRPYAAFITKNTQWYGQSLQPVRDYLIVHARPFLYQGVQSNPGAAIPFKLNIRYVTRINSEPLLEEIKSHYPNHTDLQNETNFWEIIRMLSEIPLIHEDEIALGRVIQKFGTSLPTLETVTNGIISYMNALLQIQPAPATGTRSFPKDE